ncbi:MAG: MurR/RpiR family transcriptional regulator [Clostridiales bacterium]|nr:MurR/RpiR family transcriptional regulator [Clostridiales bacterium]
MKIEDLIYENYNKLNENDLYIWNYILSNKEACSNMSMQELASNCNVSHTTILRFAQKLGLEGYSELKIYLKWGTKSKYSFNEEEIDKTHNDIVKTMDVLKNQDFSDLFKLLDSANKIYAYGTGAVQKNAANEIKRTFLTVGRLINVLEGKDELYEIGRNLQENDLIFLLSLSGENKFINEFAMGLKEIGVKIISITKVGNNKLSQLSDISIQYYSHCVAKIDEGLEVFTVSQFFIINEFLLLKYLQYKNNQLESTY